MLYQSTYCETIQKHLENCKRTVHVVNLDPAAEVFNYPVSIGTYTYIHTYIQHYALFQLTGISLDIRDLITVDEVMDELSYGPNGGLVYAMEYQNLSFLCVIETILVMSR